MADRYWVGGSANWDGTAGTKWATTSGGAGGASVPTSADDVFFDAGSAAATVTISSGNTGAKSINCTGFIGTLTGSAAISVAGSVTLVAGMTYTYTGAITIIGTGTLTSATKTLAAITINGVGITVTLGDALTSSSDFTVNQGTFTTNNYNLTATSFVSSSSNTRVLNFGSSTITLTANAAFNASAFTNLTINAGTSTIICSTNTGGGQVVVGTSTNAGTVAFYNLQFTGTATGLTRAIVGALTFNNLSVAAPATVGVSQVTFSAPCTINGTLSTTGTAGNRRVWFRGVTYGIAQTLFVNSAPSLTDADFRDIYVFGTAAPISGTRVGNLRGCSGITFDAPKTVYWNLAGAQNWSANGWAATSTGTPSTDNFPLAQDTATFTNAGSVTGTITMDAAVPYTGTVDMSGRTSAMTLNVGAAFTIYGNWLNGSGTTLSSANALTFSGRNTQTITSASKTFSGGVTVDSYGGSVELADALNIGINALTVTNGTFDTKNFNITAGVVSSANSNVRTINFGSSTVTLSSAADAINFVTPTNLTFSSGTSSIVLTGASTGNIFAGGGQTFYNVSLTSTSNTTTPSISGANTFNNLTVTAPASAGAIQLLVSANQTINGTLTVAGATAVRRIFVRSDTIGTPRTLTVNSISATDCDFRDITIAGTAAGSSPTRAGNCGGNSGITFPASKTVYWNLAGAQNWTATAWAPSSGGTPDVNNFPLAQDTAVFDNTGSVTGTITIGGDTNIGTFNASARTSAMTITSNNINIYGNWTNGTGITFTANNAVINFVGRSTQTITSNGVSFGGNRLGSNSVGSKVQLADALVSTGRLQHGNGEFDAVTYNVTVSGYESDNTANTRRLRMGSGTWTLSGTATLWSLSASTTFTLYKGTANIVLSDTSTSARTFVGSGQSYNKLTIGGATGTSTLTFTGNNQFTELASTKTVAHTIDFGATTQTFGAWTVTGTAGNVVTLTGTGTSHILAGACTSGIDYLAMGSIGFATASPGEFYAGANSTGTAGAPVYRTAKPADSTRYWVGGTGNWSATARWSTGSGGSGGASVPRSHDDVVFNSASNATAYTATVDAVTGGIRMKSLTIAGPASGNLTLAGSTAIDGIHGAVTFPATGLTRTYTGAITLSGSSTGRTLTTNGVALSSSVININGVGCEWTLGSALNVGSNSIIVINGAFKLSTYNLTAGAIATNAVTSGLANSVTIDLGSSTYTSGSFGIRFGTTELYRAGLTFNAGTSQINCALGSTSSGFDGNNQTFYNVNFTLNSSGTTIINGENTYNNLTFTGLILSGVRQVELSANQTVTGTLTSSAGTNATMRNFVRSDVLGTTRTITAAAFSGTDVDFRDITIAGASAPVSGTRLGDCKGNSGITFGAGVTRYWNLAAGGNWSATGWAASSGASPAVNNFPLAQDTAVFEATGLNSGATITIDDAFNIGTINMSARTTNTMTLATTTSDRPVYGNWINGTGVTFSGTGALLFCGRGSQTITSAGRTFTQAISLSTPGGSVTAQDAFISTNTFSYSWTEGTFDANGFNVTIGGFIVLTSSSPKTVAFGSGTWVFTNSAGAVWNYSGSNLTVTGTGTISLTSAAAKNFSGGSIAYTNVTLNQGGAGALTITGNNTFKDITNTYKAMGATNITFGATTQRVSQFTAAGEAGRVLTLQGSSASAPGTLILTGGTDPSVDYVTITGLRAYTLTDTWYAGTNSTNNGSLGWIFSASTPPVVLSTGNFFFLLGL